MRSASHKFPFLTLFLYNIFLHIDVFENKSIWIKIEKEKKFIWIKMETLFQKQHKNLIIRFFYKFCFNTLSILLELFLEQYRIPWKSFWKY